MIGRAEKIAKSLIRVKKIEEPIDIFELIKEYASFEIEYDIPFQFDGLCFFKEGLPNIIINGNNAESRQRFTLAHELGHILIPGHRNIISCNIDNVDENISDKYNSEELYFEYMSKELEANTFASELLMPLNWIKQVIMKSKSFQEIINIINRETGLSIQAITIRVIKHLKPGNIIFINYQNEDETSIYISPSTNLYKFDINNNDLNKPYVKKKLREIAKNIDVFNFNNYKVEVYDIYDDIHLEKDIYVPQKKSTDIIIEFLKNEYTDDARKMFLKINGIVANINSRKRISTMSKDEFYRVVKDKFRNREGDIREIAETEYFQQYIAKRYDEFCDQV